MRKIILLLLVVAFMVPVMAASPSSSVKPGPRKAADIMLPVGNTGNVVSLQQLADMKPSEYARLSGTKMSVTDRIGFWMAQRQLRHSINADGTVNNEKLAGMIRHGGGGGFHLGGFALGFFLGLIGVIIAYVIRDEMRPRRTKWAWIGWICFLVIFLLLIL
jgi:hypothetical protein